MEFSQTKEAKKEQTVQGSSKRKKGKEIAPPKKKVFPDSTFLCLHLIPLACVCCPLLCLFSQPGKGKKTRKADDDDDEEDEEEEDEEDPDEKEEEAQEDEEEEDEEEEDDEEVCHPPSSTQGIKTPKDDFLPSSPQDVRIPQKKPANVWDKDYTFIWRDQTNDVSTSPDFQDH